MRTAGLYGGQHPSAGNAAVQESSEVAAAKLLHSVKGIPTKQPERRVKQKVYLAQRLWEAERQRDVMKLELKSAKAELATAMKQAEIAAENLTRAAQPTAYLVNKPRDEENADAAFLGKRKTLEAWMMCTAVARRNGQVGGRRSSCVSAYRACCSSGVSWRR